MSPVTLDKPALADCSGDARAPHSTIPKKAAEHSANLEHGLVSETMQEEEKKMRLASTKVEEDRIRQTSKELQLENGATGTAVDDKFVKLDRLLSQSKVSLAFLLPIS